MCLTTLQKSSSQVSFRFLQLTVLYFSDLLTRYDNMWLSQRNCVEAYFITMEPQQTYSEENKFIKVID